MLTPDPLSPALAAYGKGRFAEAEMAARAVIARSSSTAHPTVPERRTTTKALHLLAFTAARQHDLTLARDRFARERIEAATLPGGGKPQEKPSATSIGADPEPTFEQNAAYQHAVCTAALGDGAGAEAEYMAFMRQYPDSPLLQAALKRISRMHGGNIPPAAEATWEASMKTAQVHEKQQERNESLCGPACLAEMLRREGKTSEANRTAALADEMKTSDRGTTLLGLQTVARRHGFGDARGVALTMAGLRAQALPVIARVQPGHYVLVEAVAQGGDVTVWDPDAKGLNTGGAARVSAKQWARAWQSGVALTLHTPATVDKVQVAGR